MSTLQPGLKGHVEIVVGEEHTAPHVGSGRVHVLATPVMVNLMEAAALQAVEGLLPAGHQTVGTHLDITHTAATPVGMRVRAYAEVTKVEKRTLTFNVYAEDEKERIGGGVHERIIINLERFDQRMQEKIAMIPKT
ncbi:MAG: thioesterase family protein [Proteobacteria bacterium]|nr:thioesterase family protein [Pseudomonadota bacterium]